MLDPEQNGSFHDNFLDIDYDLSKVMFIATANDLSTIAGPLRDRMEIIEVTGYLMEEKREIAKRHLIPKQLENHGITAGHVTIPDEIIDLIHSVKSGYRKKAVFLLNDSTVKALRKLKDGSGQYLWQPGLKEGQPDKLFSYRLVTSAYMPEVASGAKPVLFGDFSSYWIADRQGRSFQRLNELYAATGQIGFRATQRVDGRLVQSEGLKCLAMKA